MSRCELSWCARLLASFSVRGGREMSLRTPNQHARYDLTREARVGQDLRRYGFDATILPAIARGFLAGKKRRQPD